MVDSVAALVGVLAAAALLGAEVWIVGILALAYLVSRPVIGARALVKTGVALAASAVGYVVIVVLIGAAQLD
jgi:hypothetical protein